MISAAVAFAALVLPSVQLKAAELNVPSQYETIQEAVTAAANGDTIRIAAGVYDQGGVTEQNGISSRVKIDYKNVHIIGAGRGKTVIVGAPAPTGDGRGSGACRCIFADWAHGTIIEGVTLKGGATLSPTSSYYDSECGGGLLVKGGTADNSSSDPNEVYLVDSEIVDCRAGYGGGAKGGTLVRCLIDGCMADQGTSLFKSRAVNSVATRSRPMNTYDTDGVVYESTIVNCTLVDNDTKCAIANYSHVFNSLSILSNTGNETRDTDDISGTVLTSTASKGYLQVLAPGVGDWRLLPSSDAVGAADISALNNLVFPEGVGKLVDFAGNDIAADGNGKIDAGAIQGAVSPAAGGLRFSADSVAVPIVVNGYTNVFSSTWVFPEAYPSHFVVSPVAPDKALCRLARRNPATNNHNEQFGFAPSLDDTFTLLPPPTVGTIVTNFFEFAEGANIKWTDPVNGSDGNDGTKDHPFKTLQHAVDACDFTASNSKYVIYAKPGVYDEGTGTCDFGTFRLVAQVSDKSRLRIVSVEGPEKTFIVGAPDPESSEEGQFAGCGANALRGIFMKGKNDVSIQGFTITGCYCGTTSDSRKRGTAFYSEGFDAGGTRAQITDCIISNNVGMISIIHGGLLKRCIVKDNVSGGLVFAAQNNSATDHKNATAVACVFANNDTVQGNIGGGARAFGCTVVGKKKQGVVVSDSAAYSLNTIYYGGETVPAGADLRNCVVYGFNANDNTGTANNKFLDPELISVVDGDYHVSRRSPCIGYTAAISSDPFFWMTYDGMMDGPLVFDSNGRAIVGAYQETFHKGLVGICIIIR